MDAFRDALAEPHGPHAGRLPDEPVGRRADRAARCDEAQHHIRGLYGAVATGQRARRDEKARVDAEPLLRDRVGDK